MTKRGKTPSLLTSSSGTPQKKIAGRKRNCSRCEEILKKGDSCFEVPKPGGFTSPRTYCEKCFKEVLEKTQIDLDNLFKVL